MIPLIIPRAMEVLAPGKPAQTGGLLIGMGAIVALVVPLIAGALSDRCASPLGRRRPYIASGVIIAMFGLGVLHYSVSDVHLGAFFLGYLVLDVGINIAAAAFSGIIPDVVPKDQRGIASGYMAVMQFAGLASGLVIVGKLLEVDRMDYALGLIGLVLVTLMTITVFLSRETPIGECPPPLRWRAYLRSLWINPLEYPDFAWVWLTRALVMFGFYTVSPYLVYYMHDVIGVSHKEAPKVAGQVMAFLIVGAAISALAGGAVSDRIGRKRVVYLANGLMAAIAFGFAFASNMTVVLVLGFVFGIGFGAYNSVDWALGTDVLPSQAQAGKDMAIWHVAQVLPQTVSARVGGLLLGAFGSTKILTPEGKEITQYADVGYSAMFMLAAVFLLLGAVLLRNVRGAR
jgi:MFS family permease